MAITEQEGENYTLKGNKGLFQREVKDIQSLNFWRAFFAEFIGTFIACFYTISYGRHNPAVEQPTDLFVLAVGTAFIIAALINTLANVSGGHINPALSIGFLAAGQITVLRFIFYVLSQCSASVAAVLVLKTLTPLEKHGDIGLILPGNDVTSVQALIVEFLITFTLLFGTFAFIDENRTDGTSPAPLFVGFIVAANILCALSRAAEDGHITRNQLESNHF
ncbi:hypothetical protein DPMN_076568 [Dreissena polymorpha]|uniref:Aquaporin n=1 Tax=Dreissena polymorpha TaxID=45954 RepID=A0A9D4BFV9_DREPO|nr:hypothetical protein DPMN_076568 [Dreissena polymorpha]